MRTGHYTRLKGRVTYFRRKVPELLQERLASTEICYRLGVISSKLAERLGRRLAVEVDDFFERAKSDPMLKSADLTKLVQTALAGWREDDAIDAATDVQRYGRPLLDPREQATAWAELAIGIIEQVGKGISVYDNAFVTDTARSASVETGEDQAVLATGGRALSLGLATHYLKSAVATASMHGLAVGRRGLPVGDWQGRLFALEAHLGLDQTAQVAGSKNPVTVPPPVASESIAANAIATVPNPWRTPAGQVSSRPANTDDSSHMPFSALMTKCIAVRIAGIEVGEGYDEDVKSSKRIWLESVGDRPISDYKRDDFLTFRSTLQQVPKSYWKSEASQAFSILEIIEQSRSKAHAEWAKTAPPEKLKDQSAIERAKSNYVRISNTTINRHMSAIVPVFVWALANAHLPEDTRVVWNDLALPTGVSVTGLKPNEERPAFSLDQVQKIAEHPVWLGRKSEYFYNSPGLIIVRDSLYWGFPIALLHGMRREEFAQLRVRHVRLIDGIWVFDLHARDLKLKNGPSRRYVPLHSWLLALGFVEAMVEGRDLNERLFPDLADAGESDKFGDALGKRFARVLEDLSIVVMRKNNTESDGAYHPLRHRFITDLLTAGVREGVVDYLSGHSSGARERERERGRAGERSRYTEDPPIAELKEAIERLPVAVDFQPWIEAWHRLGREAAKTRRKS
ncbi:Integrase [Devosia sp. H5989]|nr:Integrase [Devosia sp. H5989]